MDIGGKLGAGDELDVALGAGLGQARAALDGVVVGQRNGGKVHFLRLLGHLLGG